MEAVQSDVLHYQVVFVGYVHHEDGLITNISLYDEKEVNILKDFEDEIKVFVGSSLKTNLPGLLSNISRGLGLFETSISVAALKDVMMVTICKNVPITNDQPKILVGANNQPWLKK